MDSKIINNWADHAPTENSGSINLTAGVPVPIQLDFYENGGGAIIRLSWSGPGVSKQVIPARNLRYSNPASRAAVSVDDVFELYVDGQLVSIGTEWNRVYDSSFTASPNAVIAIRACNTSGPKHAVGDFVINGESIVTNAEWKVATSAPANWYEPGFNDSAWANAVDVGGIPSGVNGMPVGSAARDIWAANSAANEVFFRLSTGGVNATQPADQVTFAGESVSLTVSASGGQGALTWTANNLPPGLAINPGTGIITGSPDIAAVGNYAVSVTVSDSVSDSVTVNFNWRVLGEKVLEANFDSAADGFSYQDDAFRAHQPAELCLR